VGTYKDSDIGGGSDTILVNFAYFDEARLAGKGTVSHFNVAISDPKLAVTVADEIDRRGNDLEIFVGEDRRVVAGVGEIGVGVFSLQDDGEVTGVHFAGGKLRRLDIVRRFDRRHRG